VTWTSGLSWATGDKVLYTDLNKLVDNLTAVAHGDSGAPKWDRAGWNYASQSVSGSIGAASYVRVTLHDYSFTPMVYVDASSGVTGRLLPSDQNLNADQPGFIINNIDTNFSHAYAVATRYIAAGSNPVGSWPALSFSYQAFLTALKLNRVHDSLGAIAGGAGGAPRVRLAGLSKSSASVAGNITGGVANITLNDYALWPRIYCANSYATIAGHSSSGSYTSPRFALLYSGSSPAYSIDYYYLSTVADTTWTNHLFSVGAEPTAAGLNALVQDVAAFPTGAAGTGKNNRGSLDWQTGSVAGTSSEAFVTMHAGALAPHIYHSQALGGGYFYGCHLAPSTGGSGASTPTVGIRAPSSGNYAVKYRYIN